MLYGEHRRLTPQTKDLLCVLFNKYGKPNAGQSVQPSCPRDVEIQLILINISILSKEPYNMTLASSVTKCQFEEDFPPNGKA